MVLRISLTAAQMTRLRVIAREYRCDVLALGEVAIDELIAAHAPRRVQTSAQRRRVGRRRCVVTAPAPSPLPRFPEGPLIPPRDRARLGVSDERRPAPADRASGRRYKPKTCACGATFVPSGPRATRCAPCRGRTATQKPAPDLSPELETVWNGAIGRQRLTASPRPPRSYPASAPSSALA